MKLGREVKRILDNSVITIHPSILPTDEFTLLKHECIITAIVWCSVFGFCNLILEISYLLFCISVSMFVLRVCCSMFDVQCLMFDVLSSMFD